ncbi:TPA: hypothetical protein ACT48M_003564 [Yersinia enterocolitica]
MKNNLIAAATRYIAAAASVTAGPANSTASFTVNYTIPHRLNVDRV